MKSIQQIRATVRQHQAALAERYGLRVIAVFGSRVRGQARKRSDIDLLAEILRPISLFDLVGAELHLGEALGEKVDLVPQRSLREELREAILSEAVPI